MREHDVKQHISRLLRLAYQIISTAVIVIGVILAILYVCGIRMYQVRSGSMDDLFSVGSVCFVSTYSSYDKITAGDVISFRVADIRVTHRAIEITSDGIITKGDMNDSPDPDPVTRDKYIGKTLFALPYGGRLLGFAQSLAGKIAIALGCVLLLLLGCFYKSE